MRQYLDLCADILNNGVIKKDRTGTGTKSVFGRQMRFDLEEGFPLVTTKDMMKPNKLGVTRLDQIIYELLWFLKGDTNIKYLVDRNVNIWNPDAYRILKRKYTSVASQKEYIQFIKDYHGKYPTDGDLGRIYGAQWRSWVAPNGETIDQIQNVITSLREDPDSRRHIVSAWNVGELDQMALPPCHVLFQFYVAEDKLSCQLYQRSGDVFLGIPFNIASYALLTMMIADQVGLGYGEFVHTLGDAHIYLNHIDQVDTQCCREQKPLPKMIISEEPKSIFDYEREHFTLVGYDSHPELTGKVSVGE